MGLPLHLCTRPAVAGIDVRDGSWDVNIGDIKKAQISEAQIQMNIVRPIFIGKLTDEKQVQFVLEQYGVRYGVVDCRPEATLAKRLQESCGKVGIELWRSEYNTVPSTIKVTRNESERLLKLERTMAMDVVHGAFQTGLKTVLPQNYKDITLGQFSAEMQSPTKVFTTWSGKPWWIWTKGGADHSFHAYTLMMIAFEEISGYALRGVGEQTIFIRGKVDTMVSEIEDQAEKTEDGKPKPVEDIITYRIHQMMNADDDSMSWVV